MRKYVIGILCLFSVMLLTAFLINSSSSDEWTKVISDDYQVTLKKIESEAYCDLMGGDRKDLSEYEKNYYFILRLEETSESQGALFKELHSQSMIGESVNYLSNDISRDLSLIAGEDTIMCAMSHWERLYNIRKDITISLAFEKPDNVEPEKLIWEDNLISGIPLKFKLNH